MGVKSPQTTSGNVKTPVPPSPIVKRSTRSIKGSRR